MKAKGFTHDNVNNKSVDALKRMQNRGHLVFL